MDEAMYIGFEAMPLDEEIKGGQRKGQSCLECRPGAMRDFLEMTDAVNHREHGFHQHAGIPEASITQFEINRVTLFGMEGSITQDDHLIFKGRDQRMKGSIRRIGPGATAIELGRYQALHELLAAIISLALARGWLQPRRIIVVR